MHPLIIGGVYVLIGIGILGCVWVAGGFKANLLDMFWFILGWPVMLVIGLLALVVVTWRDARGE